MGKVTILKAEVKDIILSNKPLRVALNEIFTLADPRTLKTWLREDNPRLTQIDSLKLIQAYTGISIEKQTEEVKKVLA